MNERLFKNIFFLIRESVTIEVYLLLFFFFKLKLMMIIGPLAVAEKKIQI